MKVDNDLLQRLADRADINDCLCKYATGVDRGDWPLVRSTYHADGFDHHNDYKGGIDGLIEWLERRFANVDNSLHFLGNCLIEFAGEDFAFVETYFASRRLRPPTEGERAQLGPQDAMCRQSWGRYLDQFERRNGEWRVSHRVVVMEAVLTTHARDAMRPPHLTWGSRDKSDLSYGLRQDLFRKAGASS